MTDQELRQIIASVAERMSESHAATERQLQETLLALQRSKEETEHVLQESNQKTDRVLQESKQETDRVLQESKQETDRQLRETDRVLQESKQETDRQLRETDRQLRELGRQIGGLGDKFGSFTEGLALPSMKKILRQRFGMEFVGPRAERSRNGRTMELDVLAYSNSGANKVFVVEVKSHLRQEALAQMKKILSEFRDFYPEHKDKELYGILAVVDASDDTAKQVLREGIYLARIHDGQFELQVPEGFQPRVY